MKYFGTIMKSREGDPFGDGWLVHIFKRRRLLLVDCIAAIWCGTKDEAELERNDRLRLLRMK